MARNVTATCTVTCLKRNGRVPSCSNTLSNLSFAKLRTIAGDRDARAVTDCCALDFN
ncbi:hypothetical protein N9L76_11110 [bacterium]|nr:hypothetical protein [bacterium]